MMRLLLSVTAIAMIAGSTASATPPTDCAGMRNFMNNAANNIERLEKAGRKIRESCINYGCEGKKIKSEWKKKKCAFPSAGMENRLNKVKDKCDRILQYDNLDDLCSKR